MQKESNLRRNSTATTPAAGPHLYGAPFQLRHKATIQAVFRMAVSGSVHLSAMADNPT
jgi:hypothetical protein